MTYTAFAKYIPGSTHKYKLIVDMIKSMNVNRALLQLKNSKKKHSEYILKTLNSCISNANNISGLTVEDLSFKEIRIGKAYVLKRVFFRAKGSSSRINKYYSRLEIILEKREALNKYGSKE